MAEEKKIGAIKEELQAAEDSMLPDFIARYEKDERSGVKSLVEKAGKRIQKLEAEYARIENLKKYEKEYADAGYICGIDEVGRGPLAGPVVAGAVILPRIVTFYISMIPRNSVHPCVKNSMMKLWRRQWQQELEWQVRGGLMKLIFCRLLMKLCGRL